uniref:Uncharacterized protein n=1 Tax=Arundo donax TaxID=35708 RepID=A0A0A9HJM2_ARUDO
MQHTCEPVLQGFPEYAFFLLTVFTSWTSAQETKRVVCLA